MADVNTRPHRSTLEAPVIRLAEEHDRLHRLPRLPHTLCFGETRKVNWQSLISVGGAQYSVPHELVDQRVWARSTGEELVVIHVDGPAGPREVARHRLTTPGRPSDQGRALPAPAGGRAGAHAREPAAPRSVRSSQLGDGSRAMADHGCRGGCAAGAAQDGRGGRSRQAARHRARSSTPCARAPRRAGSVTVISRPILAHHQQAGGELILFPARSEEHSLQRSTRSWEGLGR